MKFALIAEFKPNEPRIAEIRPVHRQYLSDLRDKGKLAISGPFSDGSGALIVLEAGSMEEAEALVKADPFMQAGLFTSFVIRPWNPVFVNRSVLPE